MEELPRTWRDFLPDVCILAHFAIYLYLVQCLCALQYVILTKLALKSLKNSKRFTERNHRLKILQTLKSTQETGIKRISV
jgi:hypothetical protein